MKSVIYLYAAILFSLFLGFTLGQLSIMWTIGMQIDLFSVFLAIMLTALIAGDVHTLLDRNREVK